MGKGSGKVALVTGAAGSLGLAASKALAEQGHRILMLDISDELSSRCEELAALGHDVAAVQADVSDEAGLVPLIRELDRGEGGIDILVNIAGISLRRDGRKVPAVEIAMEDWNRIMAVNLTSVYLLVREIVPGMVERGWGRVINISSMSGRTACRINGAHYSASKAAIVGLSRTLAMEVARANVTVNVVAPGRIDTARNREEGTAPELIERFIPAGRLGTPEEVAAAISFLASDGAAYMTGAVLDMNGGWFMTP